MKKQFYMPQSDNGKMIWLQNLNSKLAGYQVTLDITPNEVNLIKDLNNMFTWLVSALSMIKSSAEEFTSYKNIVRSGPVNTPAGAVPTLPALPPPPPTVDAGGFISVASIIQRMKNHKNYTDAIGQDLQIEGAATVIDPTTWKPTVRVNQVGNKINVAWRKQDADAIDIYVDRSDAQGWKFLARDTQPDYSDTTPLPASGVTANWNYKAVYVLHDVQEGNYSDVVSLAVKGV